jgi:N-acetylglutamate synthase-like GNAT family acetyltransferase
MSPTYPWRTSAAPVITQPTLVHLRHGTGQAVTMRGAMDDDLSELMSLHARCSRYALSGRYLSPGRVPSRRVQRSLLRTDVALVAHTVTGSMVAIGNLARTDDDPDVAEIAVLVRDDWQARGLGTGVLRQLVAGARISGYDEVVAIAPTVGGWVQSALGRLGEPLLQRTPFGEAVVRLSLAPHHVGLLGPPAVRRAPALHQARVSVSRPGVA